MNATSSPTRCLSCAETLAFQDWSRGQERCGPCGRAVNRSPGVRGRPEATRDRFEHTLPARRTRGTDHVAHAEMLDEISEELLDELAAALEEEVAARKSRPATTNGAVRDVTEEIGFGRSPAELSWAAWGFAAGFAANVALAKHAQMSAGASISEFFGPIVIGGIAAGLACAAIGWGLAKLRTG